MPIPTPFTIPAGDPSAIVEAYGYPTDVIVAGSGSEQRIQLRSIPRRNLDYRALTNSRTAQLLSNLVFGLQDQLVGVPLWPYAGILTGSVSIGANSLPVVTSGCPFVVGEWVIVWQDAHTWEAFTIQAVSGSAITTVETATKSWSSGAAYVIPLQAGRLPPSQGERWGGSTVQTADLQFALEGGAAGPGSITLPSYAGFSVLTVSPNLRDDVDGRTDRRVAVLDNVTGVRAARVADPAPAGVRSLLWACSTRAAAAELRGFLDARKGRAVPFWCPSGSKDFNLTAAASAGASTLDVESAGYADQVFPSGPYRRHVALVAPNGTAQYRKLTNAVNGGAGTDTLTLDAPLSSDLAIDSHCSVLRLCRLEEDLTRIAWYSAAIAEAQLRMRELPHEVPA